MLTEALDLSVLDLGAAPSPLKVALTGVSFFNPQQKFLPHLGHSAFFSVRRSQLLLRPVILQDHLFDGLWGGLTLTPPGDAEWFRSTPPRRERGSRRQAIDSELV